MVLFSWILSPTSYQVTLFSLWQASLLIDFREEETASNGRRGCRFEDHGVVHGRLKGSPRYLALPADGPLQSEIGSNRTP
jgi:hypothetical protein